MGTERRIRGDYLQVARDVLVERGHHGLNVLEVCTRLGVGKGSFYHHFENWQDFVHSVLAEWENGFGEWWTLADTVWDPIERCNRAFDLLVERDVALDTAILAWGHADPGVGEVVARRDRTMEYAHEQTLSLVIADPERRALVARMCVSLWVGLQARGLGDHGQVLRAYQEMTRCLVGLETQLVQEGGAPRLRVDPASLPAVLVRTGPPT